MKVLLSINPQFVEKIINGEKKFEYRKRIFKRKIEAIIIYSTMPEGKIIGEFKVRRILKEKPCELWSMTKMNSGISEQYFNEYFKNREFGYALEITEFIKYKRPIDPKIDLIGFTAPQSFSYVDEPYFEF